VTTDADGVTGGSTDFIYNLSSTAAIAGNGTPHRCRERRPRRWWS